MIADRCCASGLQLLYCHTAFAPPPDELVGDLASCFCDAQGVLVLNYSLTPAWG